MDCIEIKKLISEYIDGELLNNQRDIVEQHLHGCTSCNKIYNDYIAVSKLTADIPSVEPPYMLADQILAKTTQQPQSKKSMRPFLSIYQYIKPAFAAVLIVLAALFVISYKPIDNKVDVIATQPVKPELPIVIEETKPVAKLAPKVEQETKTVTEAAVNKKPAVKKTAKSVPVKKHVNKKKSSDENKVATTKGIPNNSKPTENITVKPITTAYSTKPAEQEKPVEHSNIVIEVAKDEPVKAADKPAAADTKPEAIEEKPSVIALRTAEAVSNERDNKLNETANALQDMRTKLKHRNLSRKIDKRQQTVSTDRRIDIDLASMYF